MLLKILFLPCLRPFLQTRHFDRLDQFAAWVAPRLLSWVMIVEKEMPVNEFPELREGIPVTDLLAHHSTLLTRVISRRC